MVDGNWQQDDDHQIFPARQLLGVPWCTCPWPYSPSGYSCLVVLKTVCVLVRSAKWRYGDTVHMYSCCHNKHLKAVKGALDLRTGLCGKDVKATKRWT